MSAGLAGVNLNRSPRHLTEISLTGPAALWYKTAHILLSVTHMPATAAKPAVEEKAPATPQSPAARLLRRLTEGSDISGEFQLPSGEIVRFGPGTPRFRLSFRTERALRRVFDETAMGEAFVNGDVEVEGDMMSALDLRFRMRDRVRFSRLMRFWVDLFLRSKTKINKNAIAEHYNYGDDFYLTFIDTKYRIYSHGQFHSDDDTLEQVSEQDRKSTRLNSSHIQKSRMPSSA